jgi:hypothetical protein
MSTLHNHSKLTFISLFTERVVTETRWFTSARLSPTVTVTGSEWVFTDKESSCNRVT